MIQIHPNQKNNPNPSTLWLFNIAMENGPFIDEFPIKTFIYQGFSMAMLNNQMVNPKRSLGISVAIRVLGGFNMFQLRCLFHFIPYP